MLDNIDTRKEDTANLETASIMESSISKELHVVECTLKKCQCNPISKQELERIVVFQRRKVRLSKYY